MWERSHNEAAETQLRGEGGTEAGSLGFVLGSAAETVSPRLPFPFLSQTGVRRLSVNHTRARRSCTVTGWNGRSAACQPHAAAGRMSNA